MYNIAVLRAQFWLCLMEGLCAIKSVLTLSNHIHALSSSWSAPYLVLQDFQLCTHCHLTEFISLIPFSFPSSFSALAPSLYSYILNNVHLYSELILWVQWELFLVVFILDFSNRLHPYVRKLLLGIKTSPLLTLKWSLLLFESKNIHLDLSH